MFNGILYVILMIALGYILISCKILPEESRPHISSVLMSVCFPAMILKSFTAVDPEELFATGLSTLVVTLIFSLLPAMILLFRKKKDPSHNLYRFICGIGNVSFVCIPLLKLFLTDSEMIAVYLHVSIQDFLIWAVFHPTFAGSQKPRQWKELLTEPCLLAVFFGMILCLCNLSLPGFLALPVDALDACVSPLALIFLGMTIRQYGATALKGSKTPLYYTGYKVILYPIFIFLILFPILSLKNAILLAMLFGSPAPVTSVVWMQKYTEDPTPAIACLIPSTILYYIVYTPLLLFLCSKGIIGG